MTEERRLSPESDAVQVDRGALLRIFEEAEDHAVIPLMVTGASMSPFLLDRRSMVFLERDRAYVPRRGDIVLFVRADGTLVLHRVVRRLEDGQLRINGDAQRWTEIIHESQVMAHVVRFCRTKRQTDVRQPGYRFLVRLWMPLRPLHPRLWRMMDIVRRIPQKLSGASKKT